MVFFSEVCEDLSIIRVIEVTSITPIMERSSLVSVGHTVRND